MFDMTTTANRITDGHSCSTPQVNTENYFCNFVIDAEESLDLDEDEEEDLDALDAFEAILDPDQNITAEGLDQDEDMEEDEDEDEEESEIEDEYESEQEEDDEQDMDDSSDDSELVTLAMTNEWSAAALKKSPLAWKKMLLAFRSIVRSDEDTPKQFTYRVESSKGKFLPCQVMLYVYIMPASSLHQARAKHIKGSLPYPEPAYLLFEKGEISRQDKELAQTGKGHPTVPQQLRPIPQRAFAGRSDSVCVGAIGTLYIIYGLLPQDLKRIPPCVAGSLVRRRSLCRNP